MRAAVAVGVVLAAVGCGPSGTGTGAGTGTATTPTTAPVATVAAIEVGAFTDAFAKHTGRVTLHGLVHTVDAPESRFLLIDVSEANCIGGDC